MDNCIYLYPQRRADIYIYIYMYTVYIYINIYIYTFTHTVYKRPHVTDNYFDTYIFQHFSTCAHGQTGWIGADLPIQWLGIADHLPALRGVEPSRKPRRLGTPLFFHQEKSHKFGKPNGISNANNGNSGNSNNIFITMISTPTRFTSRMARTRTRAHKNCKNKNNNNNNNNNHSFLDGFVPSPVKSWVFTSYTHI